MNIITHCKDSECTICLQPSTYLLSFPLHKIVICEHCKHELTANLLLANERVIYND